MRIWGKDPNGHIKYYSSPEERFWDKVDIRAPNECWSWLAKTRSGYGMVFYPDRYTEESAHRISWMLTNGPIPKGKWVLHRCDNRLCVNPKHLYCGTPSDNMRDRNNRNPVCPIKEGIYNTKFYAGEIWLIRRLKGVVTGRYASKIFKCGHSTIFKIWNSSSYLCKEGYYV